MLRHLIRQNIFIAYIGLSLVYIALIFLTPVPTKTLHQYHLTLLSLRMLDLTIIIPLILIWGSAFYGHSKLSNYAQLIRGNSDGRAIHKLSTGLLFLALWLPTTSIVSGCFNLLAVHHPDIKTVSVIVNDYLSLLLSLIGFWFIGDGARDLSEITRHRPTRRAINTMAFILIAIGVEYSHLVATTQNQLTAAYRLNLPMVLITLVVPYIFMWFVGMLATYEIYVYHLRVKGVFYSRSMSFLAYGMGALLVSSIFLQYLTTLSSKLTVLSLTWVLVLIYVLLIVLACSYVLIALGAKRLQKIEEV